MLLDPTIWKSSVFVGGAWVPPSGGTAPVIEPATGSTLGEVGVANADDVAKAAEIAAEAQLGWAATPHPQRAAVLREAGSGPNTLMRSPGGTSVRSVLSRPWPASQCMSRNRSATKPPACRAGRTVSFSLVRSHGCPWPGGYPPASSG